MPLSRKIILYALLLVGLVTSVMGTIFYFSALKTSKENQLARITHINEIKQKTFIQRLENLKSNAITLHETPPVKPIARALRQKDKIDPVTKESFDIWKARLTQIFKGLLIANPQYTQVRMISSLRGGMEIIRVERLNGRIDLDRPLQNKSSREYYGMGMQQPSGQVFLSPIELNKENGRVEVPFQPVIRAVIPFYLEDKAQGVIVINKDLRFFLSDYKKSFAKDVQSVVYDHRQNYFIHPDPNQLFKKDLTPEADPPHPHPLLWTETQRLAEKTSPLSHSNFEDSKFLSHLSLYRYNPTNPQDYLVFASQTPASAAYRSVHKVMGRAAFAGALVFLFLLPLGILLTHQVTSPLTQFTDKIRGYMQTGQLDNNLKRTTNFKELEELETAFKDLTTTIERQKKSLLDQQKKIASQEKFAALGVLSGGIAHEINNPLAIIKSYLDSLQIMIENQHLDQDRLTKLADRLNQAVLRIRDIIDGLRSFTRGDDRLPMQKIKMQDVVDVSIKFTHAQGSKKVELRYSPPDQPIYTLGKSGPLSQVVANLLSNACFAAKQTPEPWIEIRLNEKEDFVFLEIIDSGTISKEIIDKIMDPFFTTKPEGQGTGLGLSISRNIVERHQGELYVTTHKANTCFVVKLPRTEQSLGSGENIKL